MYLCVYISAMHVPRRTWLATEDTLAGLQSKLVDCSIMKPSSNATRASKQSHQAPELQELLARGQERTRSAAQSSRQEAPLEDVEMKEDVEVNLDRCDLTTISSRGNAEHHEQRHCRLLDPF